MSKAAKPVAPQKVEYNDAVAESKKYFEGDDLAATVWVSKYALKDSFGNIYETSPKQMHERIAAEIERIVDAALDAKLSPIKRMLAEQAEAGPNLRDIIGGIGWIFGLIGVAAYFRRRP